MRLEPDSSGLHALDLGEEWVRWTGLPMVFAVWAGRPESIAQAPREAFLRDYVEVPFKKSAGRVCAEVVTPYPPGIPILCPGERITQETIEYLRLELKAGVHIQGPVDKKLGMIRVLP